ncbi:MAG: 3-methyladenine DNA glycosylase [Methanobrevibacter sp.]|jgi:N-glycosylase/DNA lyase|nr:3-methyladenine DNA glycosylase [Methanobrevibacter sp.]
MELNNLINLKLTQESGQTSQPPWQVVENSYCGLIEIANSPILLKVSQNNINSLKIDWELPISNQSSSSIDEIAIYEEIANIFDFNFNLGELYDFMGNDPQLEPAIDFCKGLRLFIARDPFECIISSICSANNSIARWTKSIATISSKWGKSYEFLSGTFNSFPSSAILSEVYEDELIESGVNGDKGIEFCLNNLKSCGVGYRASYMKKASEIINSEEIAISDIFKMDYDEAFDTIMKLPGVGPKVADCILLYGFGFNQAFPSDVWIKRIVSHLYFNGKDIPVSKVREFGMDKFGNYAGYVQLYLFHYARKSGLMDKLRKKYLY